MPFSYSANSVRVSVRVRVSVCVRVSVSVSVIASGRGWSERCTVDVQVVERGKNVFIYLAQVNVFVIIILVTHVTHVLDTRC